MGIPKTLCVSSLTFALLLSSALCDDNGQRKQTAGISANQEAHEASYPKRPLSKIDLDDTDEGSNLNLLSFWRHFTWGAESADGKSHDTELEKAQSRLQSDIENFIEVLSTVTEDSGTDTNSDEVVKDMMASGSSAIREHDSASGGSQLQKYPPSSYNAGKEQNERITRDSMDVFEGSHEFDVDEKNSASNFRVKEMEQNAFALTQKKAVSSVRKVRSVSGTQGKLNTSCQFEFASYWGYDCNFKCAKNDPVFPQTFEKGCTIKMVNKTCVYFCPKTRPSKIVTKCKIQGNYRCSIYCDVGAHLPFTIHKGCRFYLTNNECKLDCSSSTDHVNSNSTSVQTTQNFGTDSTESSTTPVSQTDIATQTTEDDVIETTEYDVTLESTLSPDDVTPEITMYPDDVTTENTSSPDESSGSPDDVTSTTEINQTKTTKRKNDITTTPEVKTTTAFTSPSQPRSTTTRSTTRSTSTTTKKLRSGQTQKSSSTDGLNSKAASLTAAPPNPTRSRQNMYPNTLDVNVQGLTEYQQSNNSMFNANMMGKVECPYYGGRVDNFEKWARQYSNILRFGCQGLGSTRDSRCCHAHNQFVYDTLEKIARLTETLSTVLTTQCSKCPVNCIWGDWSDWSACPSITCSHQAATYSVRTRASQKEQYGGKPCYGREDERRLCPVTKQEIGGWQQWGAWTACSESCGGTKSRVRTCSASTPCFTPCRGDSVEVKPCGDRMKCCKSPVWTQWGSWEKCIETTRGGQKRKVQRRHRMCISDPAYPRSPRCPGRDCRGREREEKVCEEPTCESCVPRQWSSWGSWAGCVAEGNTLTPSTAETRTRYRKCEADPRSPYKPMCAAPCSGSDIEKANCCVHSAWGPWGAWSQCMSKNPTGTVDLDTGDFCGSGVGGQNRTRTCIIGTCNDGCDGQAVDHNLHCYMKPCCAPPILSAWSEWGECVIDRRSGQGLQRRRRQCVADTNKWEFPTCKRIGCKGQLEDTITCSPKTCENCVPRQWSVWGSWGGCVAERSTQTSNTVETRTRYRKCEADPRSPYKPMCSDPCPGRDSDKQNCCTASAWSQWGAWSPCSSVTPDGGRVDLDTGVPCGSGVGCQNRTRTCIKGTCNEPCYGDHVDHNLNCNMKPCCEPPVLTEWGEWEECKVTAVSRRGQQGAGRGQQSRRRQCQPQPNKWGVPTCSRRNCRGQLVDTRECKVDCGPQCVPPTWGLWTAWGKCDFTQRLPQRMRTRTCVNPSAGDPACGFKRCIGSRQDYEECICEKHAWTSWSSWSPCLYTTDVNILNKVGATEAGARVSSRQRGCQLPLFVNNPTYCKDAPESWGKCPGETSQERLCCEPTSVWGAWQAWGPCKPAQNGGFSRTRTRVCEWSSSRCTPEGRESPICDDRGDKYWIETRRCSVATTLSPTTTTTTTIGTTAVTDECKHRPQGKFPSNKNGCKGYVVCCNGQFVTHYCQGDSYFDAVCQSCMRYSTTCNNSTLGFDIYRSEKDLKFLERAGKSHCRIPA